MDWFTGIIVFLLIWWTSLFAVLPWGLRREETGVPLEPRLLRKAMITTGVAIVLWLIIYGLIEAELISFYDIADSMMEEDRLP